MQAGRESRQTRGTTVRKTRSTPILGADSEIVNKYYTHVGDEAQRQAIAAITGEINGKSARQRINEALDLIRTSKESSDMVLKKVKDILEKQ